MLCLQIKLRRSTGSIFNKIFFKEHFGNYFEMFLTATSNLHLMIILENYCLEYIFIN